jgi:peroxiredoxin Q/BCP
MARSSNKNLDSKEPSLLEGKASLDFKLKDKDEKIFSISDFKGKKVVLYFYPKDDTPGCTKEACGFRDSLNEFEKLNVVVVGISPDSPSSHLKFASKYNLNFLLLSDQQKSIAKKYKVLNEDGRIKRTTFIISESGIIEKVFENVNPEGHEKEILEYLKNKQ